MKTKTLAFLVVASTALLPRSAAAQLGEKWGYDHRGGDYLNMVIRSVADCKQVCAADARCRAYTYLRSSSTCYLKDRVFHAEPNGNAVTGVKRGYPEGPVYVPPPPPPPPIVGEMTEEAGIDRPGYDYTHFAARDAVECKRACFRDDRCRAYSFLARFGNCYLKSGVSSPQPKPDVVSGYKRSGPEGSGPGFNVTREVGWDHRGGDYRSFGAQGVDSCREACASDRRCRAYTYLRSSRSCYLKDRVYDPQQNVDAVTGVKSY